MAKKIAVIGRKKFCKIFLLPLIHSGNREEVTKVDNLFTLLIVVCGNVLSHFINKWLDKLADDDKKDNQR